MTTSPYKTYFPIRQCVGGDAYNNTTFTKDRMKKVWDILGAEGKIPWLFYDGGVRDALDYIDFMTDSSVYAYLVCDHDWETPLAMYFVNDFIGQAAKMHFSYFDAGLSHSQYIGIETCNFLLNAGGLSALIGITPKPFRHAWKFATSVGFVQKTILPNACLLTYTKTPRYVDAVVTLCTRETLLPIPNERKKEVA